MEEPLTPASPNEIVWRQIDDPTMGGLRVWLAGLGCVEPPAHLEEDRTLRERDGNYQMDRVCSDLEGSLEAIERWSVYGQAVLGRVLRAPNRHAPLVDAYFHASFTEADSAIFATAIVVTRLESMDTLYGEMAFWCWRSHADGFEVHLSSRAEWDVWEATMLRDMVASDEELRARGAW